MLPGRSSNEHSFIDLTYSNSSQTNSSSSTSQQPSSFVELDENEFQRNLISADEQGCFQFVNFVAKDDFSQIDLTNQDDKVQLNDLASDQRDSSNKDTFKLVDLQHVSTTGRLVDSSSPIQTIYLNQNKQTFDYHPVDRLSSQSTSSNQTDEFSNECDSFLESHNPQVNYLNRTRKMMKYKIKGVIWF